MEVLAQTFSENDPASPRYQAGPGLLDDIRKDGRYIAMMEFTSSILAHTDRSWHHRNGLARISREVESIFKELCRGLNARDFSHASQERGLF